MDEIIKIVIDYGVTSIIIVSLFYLSFKYIPKIIDISMERMKKRDYRDELLKLQIESNTQALKSVEKVVEYNTLIIQQNTDHRYKFDDEIKELKEMVNEYVNKTSKIVDELHKCRGEK